MIRKALVIPACAAFCEKAGIYCNKKWIPACPAAAGCGNDTIVKNKLIYKNMKFL